MTFGPFSPLNEEAHAIGVITKSTFCPFTFFAVLDEMIAEKIWKNNAWTITSSLCLNKFLIVLDKIIAHKYDFLPVSQENNNDLES